VKKINKGFDAFNINNFAANIPNITEDIVGGVRPFTQIKSDK
jgi:hypothetical protein